MAWRLLCRTAMVCGALGSMAVTQAGCLLPTTLEKLPASNNLRPTIVADKVTPAFGTLTLTSAERVELQIAAEDPNEKDVLYARLFRPSTTSDPQRVYLGFTTTFTTETPDPEDPPTVLLHRTSFFSEGVQICNILPAGGGDLFVLVADRKFCDPPANPKPEDCKASDEVPGGLSSENHWTVVCK